MSAAIIYFDKDDPQTFEEFEKRALFVKFKREGCQDKRLIDPVTNRWWNEQSPTIQRQSLLEHDSDLKVADGVKLIADYIKQHDPERKQRVWARGSLDQRIIDDLCNENSLPQITKYNNWRDVRTYLEAIHGTATGYVDIDPEEAKRIVKHNPVHDCVFDILQMLKVK